MHQFTSVASQRHYEELKKMLLEDKSKEKMEIFQKTNAHFERIGYLIGLQWFGYFLRTMVPVLVAKAHELD